MTVVSEHDISTATFLSLDDDCLLGVFRLLSPLPDLFSVAATCSRFRCLASDKRRWLRVSPLKQDPPRNSGWQCTFKCLEDAIAASRPGDTIWLAPHVEHPVHNVRIDFPVHLRGGGTYPEDTRLTCPKGADMGLDFRATCLLANMSIRSSLAPCILHRAGHLRVERCLLTCESGGLDHLSSPIVTVATSAPMLPIIPVQSGVFSKKVPIKPVEGLPPPRSASRAASDRFSTAAGPGKLVVCDTRLSGGGQGVHCRGTGVLQGVRAIYGCGDLPSFFFEVEARFHPLGDGLPVPGPADHCSIQSSTMDKFSSLLAGIDHEKLKKAAAQQQCASLGCAGFNSEQA